MGQALIGAALNSHLDAWQVAELRKIKDSLIGFSERTFGLRLGKRVLKKMDEENKETILYVNDGGHTTSKILEELGYCVIFHYNGQRAIDDINSGVNYDLAIIDLELSGRIDGDDVINASKRENPKTKVYSYSAYARQGIDLDHLESDVHIGKGEDLLIDRVGGHFSRLG